MSSPFATFRKHRTYWMAGMVLVAILAFIVAPGIDSVRDMMRSNSAPGNEVVVRWAGGKVTTGTLNYVRTQHARTQRFLYALGREVVKNGGMPKVPGFQYNPTDKRIESVGLPMMETNMSICRVMILVERAKQMGIELENKVIEDYIYRFCDRKINSKRFEEILRESVGRELSIPELNRQLAIELTASIMERVALSGMNYEGSPLVTPGNLWQNYLKLNQAARVEAYPVLAADFVKQVKDKPSDSDVRALYEYGANNFPSPNSPEPGFRRRYQANIEYVYGSWNKLMDAEKAKITEEQLKAEYERLVQLGGLQVPVDPPKLPGDTKNPATGDAGSAAKPDDAAPPAPGDPAPSQPAAAEPAATPTDNAKPTEEKPAQEKPAEEKPAAPAEPKLQSRLLNGSPLRLVSTQSQEDGVPPAVTDPKPPETAAAAQTPAATPATPAATPPAATPVPSATAIPSAAEAAGVANNPPNAPATPPMRTQTFEEARETLQRSLANNSVREQLQAKLDRIETAMKKYAGDRERDRITAEAGQKSTSAAKPIKLKELAEAEGLSYGETGMSDGFRLASSPVGRSMVENQSLVNLIMSPSVPLYMPYRSMFVEMTSPTEPDFQEFVSWKTKDAPAYLPDLADVRDEVVEAWRTQKARLLAKEEAEKLAEKLRKGGEDPFKSVLDAQQQALILNPTPFTWMSSPNEMFGAPQISFVQGLDTVGQEFMQRVFSVPVGQIVVAPNMGMNTYYVTRVVELTPTLDQLQQNFELSRGRARTLAFPERQRMFGEWYENIERQLGVQWMASEDMLLN